MSGHERVSASDPLSRFPRAGIAFPTTLSVNNVLQHFSPVPSDKEAAAQTFKKDDVVKVVAGAHIDGYPVVAGET